MLPFRVLAAVGAATFAFGAFAETVTYDETTGEPMVIRTEEDVERGRVNVRNVAEELYALLAADSPRPESIRKLAAAVPAYSKIVKGPDRSTLVFRPRYTASKKMFRALDGVTSPQTLTEQLEEQNTLVISAPTGEIDGYLEVLNAMDIPTPQILIEAKVVEVMFTEGMQRNLSFSYSRDGHGVFRAGTEVPGASPQPNQGATGDWSWASGADNFNVAFTWLLTAQDARVLSSPNILISRNETSRIVTGEDLPIQQANSTGNTLQMSTTFKRVGVTLEVEPAMVNRDNVTLRVFPQVSNVIRYETIPVTEKTNYPVPVIAIRSVETKLRMRDRQVVMIGGLYSSRVSLQQQRIPILSDLPLLGELFTGKNYSKEMTQLLFFLKVHIINPEDFPSGIVADPEDTARTSERLGDIVESLETTPERHTSVENLAKELVGPEKRSREQLESERLKSERLVAPDIARERKLAEEEAAKQVTP